MVSQKHIQNGTHDEDSRVFSREYASTLDEEDPLRYLRKQFIIPTRADLQRTDLLGPEGETRPSESSTYLCGNSLGLQPRRTSEYIQTHLRTWATQGVQGHFKDMDNSEIPPWLHMDDAATKETSEIVGALPSEVAIMETLTANLHLLMASFYRPTTERYKVIIEGKAFPSDHYAVESQIRHHNLQPSAAMVLIEPPSIASPVLPTSHILSIIDTHAASTALLLLPGIQFYTGQFFDIKTITAFAQSKGIIVGWDLAHAVGNVPMKLHDWNVDFAAWCNYKYMNCGPGAIGGLFVHSRHSPSEKADDYHPRLSGWWGSDKSTRFAMDNNFKPIPGAAGFQLSNPSALDLSAVLASLSIFAQTDMEAVRAKSVKLTGYLEHLLTRYPLNTASSDKTYTIITPSNPDERGAQLSIQLEPGLLDSVMSELEDEGVIIDERKPDVIRVAPAPLYNSFEDVWRFVLVFQGACRNASRVKSRGAKNEESVMLNGGKKSNGWSEIM